MTLMDSSTYLAGQYASMEGIYEKAISKAPEYYGLLLGMAQSKDETRKTGKGLEDFSCPDGFTRHYLAAMIGWSNS